MKSKTKGLKKKDVFFCVGLTVKLRISPKRPAQLGSCVSMTPFLLHLLPILFLLFFTWALDEEDDVVRHHDLVVVLHAREAGTDLARGERGCGTLADALQQGVHAHRLGVSRTEHLQQRHLELLQPGDTHILHSH